jgi:hypothetical protein
MQCERERLNSVVPGSCYDAFTSIMVDSLTAWSSAVASTLRAVAPVRLDEITAQSAITGPWSCRCAVGLRHAFPERGTVPYQDVVVSSLHHVSEKRYGKDFACSGGDRSTTVCLQGSPGHGDRKGLASGRQHIVPG